MTESSDQPKSSGQPAPADAFVNSLIAGIADPPAPAPETTADLEKAKWDWLFNPLWPEATWDVSGAFLYDSMLQRIHDIVMATAKRKPIAIVHGAPSCLWNGGRGMVSEQMKGEGIEQTIHEYTLREIAVELTFTNYNIDEKKLQDPLCNSILGLLDRHNGLRTHGVIVCEDLLAKHVRENHPSLRLVASVVKISRENGRGDLDYYRKLEERYDKIMLHPDDNFNFPLLEQIENKDRYTLLVNEPCIRGCQMRSRHYQLVSDGICCPHDSSLGMQETKMITNNGCGQMDNLLFSEDKRTLILSPNELQHLYQMGFRHFKVQGRGLRKEAAILYEISRLIFDSASPVNGNRVSRLMQKIVGGF